MDTVHTRLLKVMWRHNAMNVYFPDYQWRRHDTSDYHTSHSDSIDSSFAVAAGDGLDANINNYFDGVEEVPHYNFEWNVPFFKQVQ